MKLALKCPVCEGRGIVSLGFYEIVKMTKTEKEHLSSEKCRSCNGKGYVVINDYSGEDCDGRLHSTTEGSITSIATDLGPCVAHVGAGCCCTCTNNDGVVYQSNPAKYKCLLDNTYYEGDFSCPNYKRR